MKHLFTLLATFLITLTFAQQKLIAIKGTTTDAIATTLTEAINLAQPNDKIYLPGGNYVLNDSLQKPLHIIGTGYNHLIPRAIQTTTFLGNLKIGTQASGTKLDGLKLNDLTVRCNNFLIKSCFLNYAYFNNLNQNSGIINCQIASELKNINQAYVYNSVIQTISSSNNLDVKNCIFHYFGGPNNYSGLFVNNSSITNSLYQVYYGSNNIVTNCSAGVLTSFFQNYIGFYSIENNFTLLPLAPIQEIGVYFGLHPWKNNCQPINPHLEENNSFLDVQNEQFKLRVKVIPQTN